MPVARRRSPTGISALAASTLSLASACAGMEASAMQTLLDSWKAAPIDQAKAQWGPPQSVQALPGGTVYVWVDEVPTAHPPGTGPRDARATDYEPPPAFARCQRKLVAGPDGKIIGGEWSGEGCCITTAFGRCARLLNPAPGRI